MEIGLMSRDELIKLYDKISIKIKEMDIKEAKERASDIILEVGKKYEAKNGDTIIIRERFLSVYKGVNISSRSSSTNIKYPEYYIDGMTARTKESPLDILKEIKA